MSLVCVVIVPTLRLLAPTIHDFLYILRYNVAPIFNSRAPYWYLFIDYSLDLVQANIPIVLLELFDHY